MAGFSRVGNVLGAKSKHSSFWEPPKRFTKESTIEERATNDWHKSSDTPRSSIGTGDFPLASYLVEWSLIVVLGLYILLFMIIRPRERAFRLDDPEISYPLVNEIAPLWFVLVFNVGLPFVLLLIYQGLFVRNKQDLHHMLLGFFQAILLSMFSTSLAWLLVGGYAPNFLAKYCQPDMDRVQMLTNQRQTSYNGHIYFFPSEICTALISRGSAGGKYLQGGDILYNLRPAFPSARSSTAMAGWLYFTLYVGNKFGAFDLIMGHTYKIVVMSVPMFIGFFVSMTGLWDNSHSGWQIFVGIAIGVCAACITYSSKYLSLSSHVPSIFLWERIGNYRTKDNVVEPVVVTEADLVKDIIAKEMQMDEMSESSSTDFPLEVPTPMSAVMPSPPSASKRPMPEPINLPTERTKRSSIRSASSPYKGSISFSPSIEAIFLYGSANSSANASPKSPPT
jgi:hypothetical protein